MNTTLPLGDTKSGPKVSYYNIVDVYLYQFTCTGFCKSYRLQLLHSRRPKEIFTKLVCSVFRFLKEKRVYFKAKINIRFKDSKSIEKLVVGQPVTM